MIDENGTLWIRRGSKLHVTLEPTEDDETTPLYTWGASDEATLQVRPSVSSPTLLLEASTTGGEITFGTNDIDIVVGATVTRDIDGEPGAAYWALEITPNGDADETFELLGGVCQILGEVVR